MSEITLYHGSPNIVRKPRFGEGKIYNDYGQAFYCTKEIELAKEWACQMNTGGYLNAYKIDLDGLKVLNFQDKEYSVLNWISVLVANRKFSLNSDISRTAYDYLQTKFSVDYQNYDVLIGYRADDSYFSFANAFLSNSISLQQLNKAIKLGNLGVQYAIKSKNAFKRLSFTSAEVVDGEIYYLQRVNRDSNARADYKKIREKIDTDGTYIIDIIRNNWGPSDVRI